MGRIPSDKQIPNEPEKRLNPSRHPESVTGTVFSKRKHKTCVIKRDSTTFHSLGIVEHERFVIDTRGGRAHVERKRKRGATAERSADAHTMSYRFRFRLSATLFEAELLSVLLPPPRVSVQPTSPSTHQ